MVYKMGTLESLTENLPPISLRALPEIYSLVNLPADAPIPDWINQSSGKELVSLTRSNYGFSVICPAAWVPANLANAQQVSGWRALRVEEPRDWAMHGLYSRLTLPLADDAISIYIIGAYNSDHVLVRNQDFSRATQILSRFCNLI